MNQKLLLALSAILVISATSYFLLASEKKLSDNLERRTFEEWQQCRRDKNYTPFCTEYKDASLNEKCKNASAELSYCENGNKACLSFAIYYEEPTEDAPLPDCYYQCTSSCQQYASGDAFFKKNYDIEHYECAYKQL